MANRNWDVVQTLGKGRILIAGLWSTNGGSQPVATTVKGGNLFTISRTGAGQYTVVTIDKYADCVFYDAQLALGTFNVGQAAQVTSATSASGIWTFVITTGATTVPADIAAATGNQVTFTAIMRNSSVGA